MRHRLNRSDDRGASLVLVLVLVTVLALGLAALLSLATGSVRGTVALRDQAATAYHADGAIQTAINDIRNSAYPSSTDQSCFDGSNTLSLPGFYGSDSAVVTCSADPNRVLIHCPSLSQCNRPGSAILTTGRISGEDGLHIEQPNSGSTFLVHGAVFSNSSINVTSGSLSTNTRVYARGSCSGTIASTPPAACDYGTTANPLGDDPGYLPAASTVPVYRALPACTTPGSVVTFLPGYYDDAKGLSDMMAGNSACRHSTWWFTPGVYYFDFHNSGANANAALAASANVWTVDDGYLVAGTPVNAAGAVLAAPPVPASIPGSCRNPIKDAAAVGVQFIFGGNSQFAIKSGQAEICGTYSTSRPPVAVYGLTSGTETTTSAAGLATTAVTSAGNFTGAATANQAVLENTYAPGTFASWTNNGSGQQVGQVTVSGYAPAPVIPAGSNLLSAKLRVGHRYTPQAGGKPSESLSVVVTPAGGTPFTVAVPAYAGTTAGQVDVIDVTAQLAQAVHANGYSGARLTYQATVKQKGTEDLDGIQLDLSYVAPAFRAGSDCVVTGPYTGTGNTSRCALITSVNNSGNQFYVQGTTYAPKAVLDITLNNAGEQVFRFGVVVRSLRVKLTGSFSYSGPVIEVPDDSPGFAFSVYLSAYTCRGTGGCVPSGTPVLRSRVAYVDADPVTPTPGRRQVVVLSWSSQR